MKVLFVHASPLSRLGGAELSLAHHAAHAPAGVEVDVCLPEDGRDLLPYDAIVLANLRPLGRTTRRSSVVWANLWTRRLKRYRGFSLRSERDVHPCKYRDGRCIGVSPARRLPCRCNRRIPRAFERLYNRCSAVQFLSPLHRAAINELIRIKVPQLVIASPIELERFRSSTPLEDRKRAALILGDDVRVAASAEQRARSHGFEPERIPYLSVDPDEMPALYNRYQAVVVDPVMLHAFGRIAVEAMACGCRVLASGRVGALSWEDPIEAAREANGLFWAALDSGVAARLEATA